MKALRHRPARFVPAIVVILVLLALGVALIGAAIQKLSTGQWWPQITSGADSASSASWDSPWGWGAAVVAVILGLIVLLCAIIPGGFSSAQIRSPHSNPEEVRNGVNAVVTNRGLAILASSAASAVDGVASVKSSASPSSVSVRVSTPLRSTDELVREVQAAVEDRLTSANLVRTPKIRVHASTKEMS